MLAISPLILQPLWVVHKMEFASSFVHIFSVYNRVGNPEIKDKIIIQMLYLNLLPFKSICIIIIWFCLLVLDTQGLWGQCLHIYWSLKYGVVLIWYNIPGGIIQPWWHITSDSSDSTHCWTEKHIVTWKRVEQLDNNEGCLFPLKIYIITATRRAVVLCRKFP